MWPWLGQLKVIVCQRCKRYQALGPELNPVYRQVTLSHPLVVGCHYFPPGLQSPCQPKNVTVLRPVVVVVVVVVVCRWCIQETEMLADRLIQDQVKCAQQQEEICVLRQKVASTSKHAIPDTSSSQVNMCMLNHCLEWYNWVSTNFDHDRQWFNTLIPPSHESAAVTLTVYHAWVDPWG